MAAGLRQLTEREREIVCASWAISLSARARARRGRDTRRGSAPGGAGVPGGSWALPVRIFATGIATEPNENRVFLPVRSETGWDAYPIFNNTLCYTITRSGRPQKLRHVIEPWPIFPRVSAVFALLTSRFATGFATAAARQRRVEPVGFPGIVVADCVRVDVQRDRRFGVAQPQLNRLHALAGVEQ
jgi:hypothetical protein